MSHIDNVWKNKNTSKEMKMGLYNTLIVPIALYGCETWTLRKQQLVFEMAALRKILGIVIRDKVRKEDIRAPFNLTDTLVQKYMRDNTNGSHTYFRWMKIE